MGIIQYKGNRQTEQPVFVPTERTLPATSSQRYCSTATNYDDITILLREIKSLLLVLILLKLVCLIKK